MLIKGTILQHESLATTPNNGHNSMVTHLIGAVIQTKHGVFVRRYMMMQTAKQLDAFLFLLTMDGKKNNKK